MTITDLTLNPPAVAERRIRVVLISPAMLFDMCKRGNRLDATCIEGLPEDAILVHADYNAARRAFAIEVAHPSFEPVPGWEFYPEMTITFRQEDR